MRDAIEERIGGRVVEAVTQRGGFSPGLAARLRLEDGGRVFVKAVSATANPDTPGIHRREAEVVAALPPEAAVPKLLWTYDEDGWVAIGLTDIDGHAPAQPWRSHELELVIEGLQRLHALLTPSPLESATAADAFATEIRGWSELRSTHATGLDPWSMKNLDRLVDLEASTPSLLAGGTLLNFDVRADNILIADGKAYFVDWPGRGSDRLFWIGSDWRRQCTCREGQVLTSCSGASLGVTLETKQSMQLWRRSLAISWAMHAGPRRLAFLRCARSSRHRER